MLLGLILGVRRCAHRFQRLVVLAFRVQHPGSGNLPLDVDDLGPIGVLGIAQLVTQLGKLGDVGLGGLRLARARGPEREGEGRLLVPRWTDKRTNADDAEKKFVNGNLRGGSYFAKSSR